MKARNGCLALILAVAALAPLAAQAPSNARMVELAEILGKASDRESREKILAIQEVAGMGAGSGESLLSVSAIKDPGKTVSGSAE